MYDEDGADFDINTISTVVITFAQYGEKKIEKIYQRDQLISNVIDVFLTQDDTLALSTNTSVEMQAEILLISGEVVLSDIIKRTVLRTLNEVKFV